MIMDLRSGGGRDADGRHVSIMILTACADEEGQGLLLERDNRLFKMSEFLDAAPCTLVAEYRRLETN